MKKTMKTMNKVTTNIINNDLIGYACKIAYITLRAKHNKSGLDFIGQLLNELYIYSKTHNTNYLDYMEELKADLDRLERTHEPTADTHTQLNAIDRKLTHYDTMNGHIEDIINSIALAVCEFPNDEKMINYINDNYIDTEHQTLEEFTEHRLFKYCCSKGHKALTGLSAPSAMNSQATKFIKTLSIEELQEYKNRYGEDIEQIKIPRTAKRTSASDCYNIIKYNDKKNCYELKTVYKTINRYQYIEHYDNGEIKGYDRMLNPLQTGDINRLEKIIKRANLSNTELQYITALARAVKICDKWKDARKMALKEVGYKYGTDRAKKLHTRTIKALKEKA